MTHRKTYTITRRRLLVRMQNSGSDRCPRCEKKLKVGDTISITRSSHPFGAGTKHYHSSCRKELYL